MILTDNSFFPHDESYRTRFPKEFLQPEKEVDPWYYNIREDRLPRDMGESRFLCWSNKEYQPTDKIKWNPVYIPLIRTNTAPRKITHREIANIKGFPGEYDLSESSRSWLYRKLMYSENVVLVRSITKELNYKRQINRGLQFEKIFARYLERFSYHPKNNHVMIKREPLFKNIRLDFELCYNDQVFLFELKLYHSLAAISSKVTAVCERISALKEEGVLILVVANEIPDAVKEHCLNEFGVHIWDVGNLLWVFGEFIELKSEFIAFLDYTVDDIEAKPPTRTITTEAKTEAETKPESEGKTDWGSRLSEIKSGKEYFKAYEDICVEILKYVLGDYLTLWRKQEPSNDGLYRFDLCCKIKEGSNQDFFDTIKNYFNTKYIVFEFKNCSEKIGQKEIYTTEKYLYEKALRKVAIIISREGADEHAVKAAKGSLREEGKLILCLSDQDLLEMIDLKRKEEQEPADLLEAELDNLLIHLEK